MYYFVKQESKNHYISSYQNMLKLAAKALFKSNRNLIHIEYQVRETWLLYLKTSSKKKTRIIGIFAKLNKKNKEVE